MGPGSGSIPGGSHHAKNKFFMDSGGRWWERLYYPLGRMANPGFSNPLNHTHSWSGGRVPNCDFHSERSASFPGSPTTPTSKSWLTSRKLHHSSIPAHHFPPSHPGLDPNEWVEVRGNGTVPPNLPEKPRVLMPIRLVSAAPPAKGTVNQLDDGAVQLTLELMFCTQNGEQKRVKVLIDTGAQINVVRRGLFSEEVLRPAKRPLWLSLANGQPFWGGDTEIATKLVFGKHSGQKVQPWKINATFYEAEIKAEAIIGLPWLRQNGLDILTREGCLGERVGYQTFPIGDCPENVPQDFSEGPWIDTNPSQMVGFCAPRRKAKWPRPLGVSQVACGLKPTPPLDGASPSQAWFLWPPWMPAPPLLQIWCHYLQLRARNI